MGTTIPKQGSLITLHLCSLLLLINNGIANVVLLGQKKITKKDWFVNLCGKSIKYILYMKNLLLG